MRDLFDFLRSHHVSVENANQAESIMYKYAKEYAAKECAKLQEKHEEVVSKLEQRIKDLSAPSKGFAEMVANAIKENPDLFKVALTQIIVDSLFLDDNSVEYAGEYVQLNWMDHNLGEVCIQSYSDD